MCFTIDVSLVVGEMTEGREGGREDKRREGGREDVYELK